MGSSKFVYRSAVVGDAADMVEVHYISVHAIESSFYTDKILYAWSPKPDEPRRRWLADLIMSETTLCDVAIVASGRVAGFCIALPAQSQLKALYVRPEYSGYGIGSGLLKSIEEQCRTSAVNVLELNASFNAVNFYRYNGYATIRETTQVLGDGTEMGAMLMAKGLCIERNF